VIILIVITLYTFHVNSKTVGFNYPLFYFILLLIEAINCKVYFNNNILVILNFKSLGIHLLIYWEYSGDLYYSVLAFHQYG
jgi:hypothetical protein